MTKTAEKVAEATLPLEGATEAPAQPVGKGRSVAAHKGQPPVPVPASPADATMAMLAMMERMATNKEVDTSKLAQIREFGEAILADQRRTAFDAALAEMQGDLPVITQRGMIEIRAKGATGERDGKVMQATKYAKWEDINEAIKPVLKKHGFGLRFKTGLAPDGRVMVTGILSGHGHREESEFVLPHDSTGSKNAVQAIGSSTAYGKRYAASALLNITSRGEDDDAASTGDGTLNHVDPAVAKITQAQIDKLVDLCEVKGCPRPKFLAHIRVDRFEDIPAAHFEDHMQLLGTYGPKAK